MNKRGSIFKIKDYGTISIENEKSAQFIGKNDKGKQIFEGDYDCDGIIAVWCDRCFSFQFAQLDMSTKEIVINCHNCEGNFMFLDHFNNFESIGNLILD